MRLGNRVVSAIGFDLDFTLYDQSQHTLSFFRAASEKLACETGNGVESVFDAFVKTWQKRTPRYGALFDEVLSALGLSGAHRVQSLVEEQRAWRPALELYPGVRTALAKLRGSARLFLITDGHATTQRYKVEALGLAPYFDVLVYTDEFGSTWQKPNNAPFRYAAELLAVRPEECLYAGDNPMVDGEGARCAGMGVIRVLRGPYSHLAASSTPEKEVLCASELADLVVD